MSVGKEAKEESHSVAQTLGLTLIDCLVRISDFYSGNKCLLLNRRSAGTGRGLSLTKSISERSLSVRKWRLHHFIQLNRDGLDSREALEKELKSI